MKLAEELIDSMRQHAMRSPDREVCGFVYRNLYIPLENASANPKKFKIDPDKLAKVLRTYGEPIAIFHTHPTGKLELSEDDRDHWYYMGSMMILGAISEGRFMVKSFVYGHQGN